MTTKTKAARAAGAATPTCSTCTHWSPVAEAGRCTRYPPTPLAGAGFVRPTTFPQDWCGEFKGRGL